MNRVFVLEPPKLPIAEAADFGEIVYVFGPHDRRASIWSDKYRDEILERLEALSYNPESDYFVVAGHMVPLAIAIATLTANYGEWKALLWSTQSRTYNESVLGEVRHETVTGRPVSSHQESARGHASPTYRREEGGR